MFIAAIASTDGSTYWATIAQVDALFALTLVLEVRRTARAWKIESKALRRIQSVGYLLLVLILVSVMQLALSGLAYGGAPDSLTLAAVNSAMGIAMASLAFGPLWNVILRGNFDLLSYVARAVPWSTWHRQRSALRRAQARSKRLIPRLERLTSRAQFEVEGFKVSRDEMLKMRDEGTIVDAPLEDWMKDQERRTRRRRMAGLRRMRDELVESGEQITYVEFGTRMVTFAEEAAEKSSKLNAEVRRKVAEMDETLSRMTITNLDDEEVEAIQFLIEHANDESVEFVSRLKAQEDSAKEISPTKNAHM